MTTFVWEELRDIALPHVFDCGQCFRWNENEDGSYTGVAGAHACRAVLSGEADNAKLTLHVSGGAREFWQDYFDLTTDYGRIKEALAVRESKLIPAMEQGYGIRILRQEFWEVLISFLLSQNNNIPRIKTCIEAISSAYGDEIGIFDGSMRYAFPSPEVLAEVPEEDLAALKLGYRSAYLVRAASRFLAEGTPRGSEAQLREALLAYHGVGPKVANCILLFGLRCLEAFPIDVWVRKIMQDLYGFDEKDTKAMQTFAEARFGEFGGIAQQYLFFYYRERDEARKR